jgi:hypothetical protein
VCEKSGNFAAFGSVFVFNGQQGYEAGGQLSFILGALLRLIASGARLFGRRAEN